MLISHMNACVEMYFEITEGKLINNLQVCFLYSEEQTLVSGGKEAR